MSRELPVGTVVDDRYEVVRQIGLGGMGQVLRARDLTLERDVALKVLNPSTPVNDNTRRRFLNEARALARVRHQNVVGVHDIGHIDGAPYMVMEYVKGVDLEDWLYERPERSMDVMLDILEQICRGVQAIHDAGTVHRDIKPANVLLGVGARVVIADLGLARFLGGSASTGSLASMLGTPRYMAPESIIGTVHRDSAHLADVYSIAVVAFEMLTGRAPFEGTNIAHLMTQHVTVEAPRPSSLRPDLPEALDKLMGEALSKDPSRRPGNPFALFVALHAACAGIAPG